MAGPPPPPRIRSPVNKFDTEATDYLRTMPPDRWAHLVDPILTWLQDVNWPVFESCCDVLLLQDPDVLIQPLLDVFDGGDVEWQVNCWQWLLRQLPMATQVRFKEPMLRWRDTDACREAEEDWGLEGAVQEFLRDVWEYEGKMGEAPG